MKRYTESFDLNSYAECKERIDKLAESNCKSFGNIILLCMGLSGGCREFSIKDENRYNLDYMDGDKKAYRIFSFDEIYEALKDKEIKVTISTIDKNIEEEIPEEE